MSAMFGGCVREAGDSSNGRVSGTERDGGSESRGAVDGSAITLKGDRLMMPQDVVVRNANVKGGQLCWWEEKIGGRAALVGEATKVKSERGQRRMCEKPKDAGGHRAESGC